jgi:hypothetical protein
VHHRPQNPKSIQHDRRAHILTFVRFFSTFLPEFENYSSPTDADSAIVLHLPITAQLLPPRWALWGFVVVENSKVVVGGDKIEAVECCIQQRGSLNVPRRQTVNLTVKRC